MSRPSHPCGTNHDAPHYAPYYRTPSAYVLTLVWKTDCPIHIMQEETWQFCPACKRSCPSQVIVNSTPFFRLSRTPICLCWGNVRPFYTKPEDHFLSAVRDWLFYTVAATFRVWGHLRIIWDKPGAELSCEGTNETKCCIVRYSTVRGAEVLLWPCALLHTVMWISELRKGHCCLGLQNVRFIVSERGR